MRLESGPEGPSADTTESEWDRVVDINLKGLYFISSAAIPHLTVTHGCIVNMSSDAGVQGNAGAAVYCASKGGVSNLTCALGARTRSGGHTRSTPCAPAMSTRPCCEGRPRPAQIRPPISTSSCAATRKVSQRVFIQPTEIAELIWFLCQPSATAITGANISIDHGLSAGIT